MTSSAAQPMTTLTADESWALLSSVTLGRLVTSVDDVPDIFPVNFVVQRRTILIRTAEGTKLSEVSVNRRVAFERPARHGAGMERRGEWLRPRAADRVRDR